jgi:BolA family transcriptional regulator, general stress-responsive regulator
MSATRLQKIESRLRSVFAPTELAVEDDSHLHAGHAGARDGKGHFRVFIVADAFSSKSTIQCHRLVYSALAELMQSDIHALSIEAHPPKATDIN